MKRIWAFLSLAPPASFAAVQRHPAFGIVLEVAGARRSAVISHQDIPSSMDAMTMSFPVRDPKELEDIPVNAMVDFTVVVDADDAYAEDVRIHHYVMNDKNRTKDKNETVVASLRESPCV